MHAAGLLLLSSLLIILLTHRKCFLKSSSRVGIISCDIVAGMRMFAQSNLILCLMVQQQGHRHGLAPLPFRDIWNAGLPLLQHDTRHYVKRAFNAAAAALSAVSSPLTDLRTRLHLEVAKCSLAADAPGSALEEAARADILDYVATPEAHAQYRLERPWDRHLQPLLAALRSRNQDRVGPSVDTLAPATALIQRAREARAPNLRRERLRQAVVALQEVPLVQPVASAPEGDSKEGGGVGVREETEEGRAQRYRSARTVTGLWGEVVKTAWMMHLYDVVLQAAPYVLWADWTPDVDPEMAMLQVGTFRGRFVLLAHPVLLILCLCALLRLCACCCCEFSMSNIACEPECLVCLYS